MAYCSEPLDAGARLGARDRRGSASRAFESEAFCALNLNEAFCALAQHATTRRLRRRPALTLTASFERLAVGSSHGRVDRRLFRLFDRRLFAFPPAALSPLAVRDAASGASARAPSLEPGLSVALV